MRSKTLEAFLKEPHRMTRALKNVLNDETGAEALEYALVVGLVVIGIFLDSALND